MADTQDVEGIIEGIRANLRQIDDMNRIVDGLKDGPAKDAAKKTIEALKELVKKNKARLVDVLEELGSDAEWKLGKEVVKKLARIGIRIGEAFGEEAAEKAAQGAAVRLAEGTVEVVGKVLGGIVFAVIDNLLNPTPISGVDKRVVDSQVVKIHGKCYRITWYQTKGSDELIWSDVRTEAEEIPCPDVNP
jgi:hypothetical protein